MLDGDGKGGVHVAFEKDVLYADERRNAIRRDIPDHEESDVLLLKSHQLRGLWARKEVEKNARNPRRPLSKENLQKNILSQDPTYNRVQPGKAGGGRLADYYGLLTGMQRNFYRINKRKGKEL